MFYSSQTTRGFYTPDINPTMPEDAQLLPEGLHASLIAGASEGKIIVWDGGGLPFLQDAPKPTIEALNSIVDASRNAAYALEADPLFFQYQRGEVDKQVWLDKIAEIKTRFPKV